MVLMLVSSKRHEISSSRIFISAAKDLFDGRTLFPPFNWTSVTLIPKMNPANKVGDYRSIACYTVIYKVISRVLAGRLQKVIGEVIDQAQSGFIPGRQMLYNFY